VPRTKEAGKQIYPIIVIFIYTIKGRVPKTRIIIKIIIKIKKGKKRIRILVNSGIEASFRYRYYINIKGNSLILTRGKKDLFI
jgi:hypothetical protein